MMEMEMELLVEDGMVLTIADLTRIEGSVIYMGETSCVTSYYYGRRFAIHGRNIHLPASTVVSHDDHQDFNK